MGSGKALGLGSWWDPGEGQSGLRGGGGKEAARRAGMAGFLICAVGGQRCHFFLEVMIGFLFAEAHAVGGCGETGLGLGDPGASRCSHPAEQEQWTLTLQERPSWGAEGQGWAGASGRQGQEPGRLWGRMAQPLPERPADSRGRPRVTGIRGWPVTLRASGTGMAARLPPGVAEGSVSHSPWGAEPSARHRGRILQFLLVLCLQRPRELLSPRLFGKCLLSACCVLGAAAGPGESAVGRGTLTPWCRRQAVDTAVKQRHGDEEGERVRPGRRGAARVSLAAAAPPPRPPPSCRCNCCQVGGGPSLGTLPVTLMSQRLLAGGAAL